MTTVSPFSGFPLVKFAGFVQSQSLAREVDQEVSFACTVAAHSNAATPATYLKLSIFIVIIPFISKITA